MVIRFLAKRFANYVVLCFIATALAYGLSAATFNPLKDLKERRPAPKPAAIEAKRQALNLDEPIPLRFVTWIGGVVQGDLGEDTFGRPLNDQFARRVGVSLRLFTAGTVLGTALGIVIGVWGALRQYRFSDYVFTFISYVLLAMPVFVIAVLLKYGALEFADRTGWRWLKFTGEYTPGLKGGFFTKLNDRVAHFVLPTLTIALGEAALFSRYQRNAMLDVLSSDFIRTARAKGLTKSQAIRRHGVRTALIPMATLFAFTFGLIITGGVITERVFTWFGMGDWFVIGITEQDTNIVAATTLFVAICTLTAGWLADVVTVILDPRVRRS
jgi:peptide/nickel transport system permease protein